MKDEDWELILLWCLIMFLILASGWLITGSF